MENLNEEQIKKALECCHTPLASDCNDCGYRGQSVENGEYIGCSNRLMADALALITSQEQRIKELTEELENERSWADSMIDNLRDDISELAKENERLRAENQSYAELEQGCYVTGYKKMKADTVRNMQERLIAEFRKDGRMNYYLRMTLDQIAKEMLEDKLCT